MALKLGTIIFIVWLAWTIRPLMEEKHSVQFHEKQLSPDFLRNEQGLWLHSSSCFPPSSPSGSPSSAIKCAKPHRQREILRALSGCAGA